MLFVVREAVDADLPNVLEAYELALACGLPMTEAERVVVDADAPDRVDSAPCVVLLARVGSEAVSRRFSLALSIACSAYVERRRPYSQLSPEEAIPSENLSRQRSFPSGRQERASVLRFLTESARSVSENPEMRGQRDIPSSRSPWRQWIEGRLAIYNRENTEVAGVDSS